MPGLSNWREEFNLSEVVTGKMTDKEALKTVTEKDSIKNKVTINPKLDEAVKEIGGEVVSMVEADTTAQKQRLDMKQMILDRQKLKLRRKDMSAAKQEKKQDVEGDPTNAMKQANVIAQEEVVDIKKENEKKRKNALQIQKVIGEGDWIQKATKNMRKDKPCTGEKFGSESCPPGSKRYNLAKTFRKMAKEEVAEGVLSMIGRTKKKEEKKPQKAMDAGAKVRRAMKRREHAKYVSGSTDNVPDDIREGVKGQSREARREMAAERRTKGDPMNQEGDPSKRLTAKQGRRSVKPIRSWSKQIKRYGYNEGEDKAFNFVLDKIRKEVGKDGYVSKNNPRKPQSDADKAKVRAHQAKVDKENAAARAKDPSQGRYPKG